MGEQDTMYAIQSTLQNLLNILNLKTKKQKKNPEPKSSQVSHHQFSGKRE